MLAPTAVWCRGRDGRCRKHESQPMPHDGGCTSLRAAALERYDAVMTGTTRRGNTARVRFVRFVALLAVVSGLLFGLGMHCVGGMPDVMSAGYLTGMAGSGTASCGATVIAQNDHGVRRLTQAESPCTMVEVTVELTAAADGPPDTDRLGGVLAACLAFLIAVLAAMAARRPALRRARSNTVSTRWGGAGSRDSNAAAQSGRTVSATGVGQLCPFPGVLTGFTRASKLNAGFD